MKRTDRDIVQYYVINEQLIMSQGKIAVQVAHAATTMTLHYLFNDNRHRDVFQAWLSKGQKKVVLQGSEARLQSLAKDGFLSIRDAGHHEIPEGSLTVVVLPPMDKEAAGNIITGLKLL